MARHIQYPAKALGKRKATRPLDLTREQEALLDGYREKLAKYVPAEAVAFFALAYGKLSEALSVDQTMDRVWWLLVLAAGSLISVLFAGGGLVNRQPFPWYFYVLTPLAFIAWSFGTTGIGSEMIPGWLTEANDVILAGAVFIVPGLDQLLTRRRISE